MSRERRIRPAIDILEGRQLSTARFGFETQELLARSQHAEVVSHNTSVRINDAEAGIVAHLKP